MPFAKEKFKSLIHYICWRCHSDPSKLGAVKLNKILWLSDFISYYNSGQPITGARYVRRKFGPVPGAIVPALKELETEGALSIRDTTFHGKRKKEYAVKKKPSLKVFDEKELKLIDTVITYVCESHTAKSISEQSHDHLWESAEDGEEIPYFTIFAKPGEIDEEDRNWANQALEAMGSR